VTDALDGVKAVPPAVPAPDFTVLGARGRHHAALPTLDFDVHVSEPSGRAVYLIALSAQVMIEPARRAYDADARERLSELFGPPERWSMTSRTLVWAQLDVLVPSFTGATTFRLPLACSYDQEVAAAKYLYSVRDGEVPLAFNFNGTIYYRDGGGRLQMTLVPWRCTAELRMPVAVWRELMERHYPGTGWIALRTETIDALAREKARRGTPTFDVCVARLLEEAGR
jgi:Family of unknown function (DUF6084)